MKGKKTEKIESGTKKSNNFGGTDAGRCVILLSFSLVFTFFGTLEQHCCSGLPRKPLPFFREESTCPKKIKKRLKKAPDFSLSNGIFI